MSWRDNLVKASFRGVSFHISSSDYAIGRRNILHQYPLKDVPNVEDLGLDADEFTLDAYVVQNKDNDFDYFAERDALIKAIKKEGSGKLIHPFLGEITVAVLGKARVRESFSEGGWARFTITFVLAGKNQYPTDVIDPLGKVDEIADDLIDLGLDNFGGQYTLEGLPAFVSSLMSDDFNRFIAAGISTINNIKGSVEGAIEDAKNVFNAADIALSAILSYPCQIGALVNECGEAILEIANIVGEGYNGLSLGLCSDRVYIARLDEAGDTIKEQLGISMVEAILDIVGNEDDEGYGKAYTSTENNIGALVPLSVTTRAKAYQASNRMSFVNMTKSNFLAQACKAAIRIDYKSYNQAKETRDNIVSSMDYLLNKIGDESASDPYSTWGIYIDNRNVYSGIEELKSAFTKALKEKFLNLPIEIEYECPPDGTTTLQLAYDQYKDLDREDEIFTRNQPTINHPGFLNGTIDILNE